VTFCLSVCLSLSLSLSLSLFTFYWQMEAWGYCDEYIKGTELKHEPYGTQYLSKENLLQ